MPAVAAHARVRDDLAVTRSSLRASRAEGAALRVGARSANRRHASLVSRTEVTNDELLARSLRLDRAGDLLDTRTAQRAWAQNVLDQRMVDLQEARASLDAVEQQSLLRTALISQLDTCLAGVTHAVRGLGAGHAGAALDGLRLVSDACSRADAALTPGEPGVAAFPYDFADPFVLATGGGFYGYSTNGGGGHVQLIHSLDLRSWEWLGEALPALPPWADRNRTWAPSVLARGGTYVLYYAVRHRSSGHQCISLATAGRPDGPFVDVSSEPFLCQHDLGGSIDPSPFVDRDGRAYLLWKSEGETVGRRAVLWSALLREDGRALAGPPTPLLTADRAWEGRTIEGPSMARVGDRYQLLYSANSWNSAGYGIGDATCASPAGPCRKPPGGALFTGEGRAMGPGGPEPLWVGDRLYLAFHAWTAPDVGYPNRRKLHLRPVSLDGTGRFVLGAA